MRQSKVRSLRYYEDFIHSNPEWEYAGVFSDDGISGTRDENRPGFMEMIKQCKKGKIDMILAKSLSRFSRNTLQCISYIRMLKDRGIIIRFEKEGLDTSRVTSEIFFTWTSAFAQGESESLSNNVKWGKRKGYSQGKFTFPYASMLGYKKGENGEPEIVPEEAEHSRAFISYQYKVKIPVIYDTDEIVTSDEGQRLYKNDIVWCQRFNIQTVADLETRIVDSSEYQSLWIDRCDRAYNLLTQTNEYDRSEIQRQYPDLFLYGANNDLTIYYFENEQGQLFEFAL